MSPPIVTHDDLSTADPAVYAATARTVPSRRADRARYDRDAVHAILDEALVCHLGFVVHGEPRVLPMVHARIGDVLYVHGSTGGGPLLAAATAPDGLAVCLTVTLVDGLVFAKSAFHHSVNYRSVVAHGRARLVEDPVEKNAAMGALLEHVAKGRSAECRPASAKEFAATAVLALPLEEVSAKTRTGGVADDDADLGLPHWAGVLPLRLAAGIPEPAEHAAPAPTPPYLAAYRRGNAMRSPWAAPVVLEGRHVRLEPLAPEHIDGLFAAGEDPEVWRWLSAARPRSRDEMAEIVASQLRAVADGDRVVWTQIDQASGAIVGSTSYYDLEPAHRGLEIGGTWLGRPWWRTALNTEAKLLLLEHAFDELGAVRVMWKTDLRNERSRPSRAWARSGRGCCAPTGFDPTAPSATPSCSR